MSEAPPDPKGKGMTPRITVITLAVADLERSLAFYRDGLGQHLAHLLLGAHVVRDQHLAAAGRAVGQASVSPQAGARPQRELQAAFELEEDASPDGVLRARDAAGGQAQAGTLKGQ